MTTSNEHNNAPAVPQGEPVAWKYELAVRIDAEGRGSGWCWHLTDYKPSVPEGMIRNLRPLTYADAAPAQESINDRSERQFMERMAANHGKLTEFSQTFESFTHDYQRLYSTYKSYRDMLAGLIKERDSLRDQVAKPAQDVGLTGRQFDLICQAIDKADTVTMEGDYMLDSDDCIAVVRVMQALFDIKALREKQVAKLDYESMYCWLTAGKRGDWIWNHVLTDEEKNLGNDINLVVIAALRAKGGK